MSPLNSALRLFFGFIWMAIAATIVSVLALLLLPFRLARIRLCNVFGKVVGGSITHIAGVTPDIRNRERLDGSMPAIYVMNHASTLDAFMGIWLCPMGGCGVFKKEIVRIPFYGWLAWLSGHLLIDRGNRGKAVEALAHTAAYVKKNRLGIWIMPEGTRARDGRLRPFKKGFVHLALATGYPVVPVVVHGAHKNWVARKWRLNPTVIQVDVLPPIDTSTWREATSTEHAEAVHAIFASQLRDDQKPLPVPLDQSEGRAVLPAASVAAEG